MENMLRDTRKYLEDKYEAVTSIFASRKPHFNFITAHYTWIITGTFIASILIYAPGRGNLRYIDALLFASGVNTQAGLNPVDINKLNTFQQVVMYIFPMLSNPITLHSCVVLLRLYWFEKRFQSVVREARNRRTTLTKSRSKARPDFQGDAEEGVNGRNITIVPRENGRSPRVTNDGLTLGDDNEQPAKVVGSSDGSDTTVADEKSDKQGAGASGGWREEAQASREHDGAENGEEDGRQQGQNNLGPTTITFADTVKRSDGLRDELNLMPVRSHTQHIAILERQRNQDNEILRIPGPRDAERGLGPRRLDQGNDDDDNHTLSQARTRDSRADQGNTDHRRVRRNPTITIEEPTHRAIEEAEEDAEALCGTFDALRFRKPRAFNRSQNKLHEDNESVSQSRAVRVRTLETIRNVLTKDKTDNDMPYLSYTPTLGRNSNFVGLTLEQREELGGIEYRSLRTLAIILLWYFWGFQLLALVFLLPYIRTKSQYGNVVTEASVSQTWWGFWTANAAFMDVGFTLTPDSMLSFQQSQYILVVMWWFIIIGNTGFPVMLRFIIWVMAKVVPKFSGLWEELRFLLDHPRRCFTLLFPAGANWWLFWILVILNVADLLFFIILDLNSEAVEQLSTGTRVANGLFQAASTRTAGFASLPLSELHPAIPVLYMIMMYISVFPIAISIRKTNVYEEKSLGVYHAKTDDDDENAPNEADAVSYVSNHLRRQLSFDLWYVFLGFFILTITEGGKLKRKEFSPFDVLFEIISAYGTVGMSLGVAGVNASLCSQFSTLGKLIIIAMEIRGRHRGLPYGLDRAVILPSESRFKREAEEIQPPLVRSATGASAVMSGAQRRPSSVNRGRSLSGDRDRRIISRFLHPGPVVPPGVVHSHHNRTKSGASDALSFTFSFRSRRPQPFNNAAVVDDDENETPDGLSPLHSVESRPQHPRRAETSPQGSSPGWQ